MSGSVVKRFRARLAVSTAMLALAAGAAFGQSANISAPAQPLSDSLKAIARQTGENILFTPDAVAGVQAPALNGHMTARDAVDNLLKGTNLESVSDGNGGLIVRRAGSGARASVQPATSTTPQDADQAAAGPEQVVVTGSRIRNGFATPTPVTVTSADQLLQSTPLNIADALNQLPAFGGSTFASQGGGGNVTAQTNGQNLLSLRNLGPTRTLILLDGRRLPGSNQTGTSDIDMLPQNLVSRVDVVTGGASAAYGSDAVAGVVNFVLDTKFEGLKADTHEGQSNYGDSYSTNDSIAYGTSFLDGRGRVVASAQYFYQTEVGILNDNHRPWFVYNSGQIPNPVTGALPAIIRVANIRSSAGSNGGLITAGGTLKGTQFLAGGTPAPFNFGGPTGSSFQSGGDGGDVRNGLFPAQRHGNAFVHGEYDITDDITVFAEGLYSHQRSRLDASIVPEVGAGSQFTIFSGNPFIPASIQTAMTAQNLTSISVGRYLAEFPPDVIDFQSTVQRAVVGFKGNLLPDLLSGWQFDTSYAYGATDQNGGQLNLPLLRNLYAAADAVTSNGKTVCNSTLAGLDAGCVPLNIFGTGSASPAAIAWIEGSSTKDLRLKKNVAVFNLNGDLGQHLQLGAGPISVAAGYEYREESAVQTSDPGSSSSLNVTGVRGVPSSLTVAKVGNYQLNNPQPFTGSFDVNEGYLEVGVPILKDLPFAEALDFNAAARHSEYSQSGGVTTWKYGLSWQVDDDVRLRATSSEDIRAPNILELFNSQTQSNQTGVYLGKTTQVRVISSGNTGLTPENALTWTGGIVLRPHWLEGFQASIDYYKIGINRAIGTLAFQTAINQCAVGNVIQCNQITVNPDGTLIVRTPQLNLSTQQTAGYDLEASYDTNVYGGTLNLRLLANHILAEYSLAPGATFPTVTAGTPPSPIWKSTFSATYGMDAWSVFLQERFISASVIDPSKTQGIDVSLNHIPAIWYTDATLKYHFQTSLLGDHDQEAYFTINNLWNQQPPISGGNPTNFSVPINFAYDAMGRYFTVGLRVSTD